MTKYGKEVAVKLLQQTPLSLDDHQFENELKCLMFLKHQNIVSILGYCNETQENIVEHKGKLVLAETTHRALCFQYLENGNLQRHLSGIYDVNSSRVHIVLCYYKHVENSVLYSVSSLQTNHVV